MDAGDHHIGRRRTCMCCGCGNPILDQFILRVAPDLEWHASCLKCADCGLMLDEMRTCFVRDGKTYCKMDYLRLFGAKCARCNLSFGVADLVMRARSLVYHVDCFRCVACGRQLVPGDEFALADDGLLCRADHDLALDQAAAQLQCAGGVGGSAASLKAALALSPPDSVTSEDVAFNTAAANNNNNNNNETTNNASGGGGGKSSSHGGTGGHSSRSGRSHGGGKSSSSGDHQKTTRIRTVLNEKQLHTLRTCYGANPRPDALMKEQLVEMTGLSPRVIRVWFQNKRCKDKKRSILMKQLQLQQQQQQQQQQQDKSEPCGVDEMWLYHKGASLMNGSPPSHEAQQQLQQQLQQQQVFPSDLHHHHHHHPFQTGLPPGSPSPWNSLGELGADDLEDAAAIGPPPPGAASAHPGGGGAVMASPFQQLVGSFGPGTGGSEPADDDTVVSLDEPLVHHVALQDVHKARAALFSAQRLNTPV